MLQFLWVFGSCQADFVYVPIYMSCYDLHTATENNQKAREALEAFMSRLQASGPTLWQRWGGPWGRKCETTKTWSAEKMLRCWLLLYSGQSMTVLHFAVWDMLNHPTSAWGSDSYSSISWHQLLRKRTKWRETVRQNHLVPTFDMIFKFAMINIGTSIDIQAKRCESTNALDKIHKIMRIHKDASDSVARTLFQNVIFNLRPLLLVFSCEKWKIPWRNFSLLRKGARRYVAVAVETKPLVNAEDFEDPQRVGTWHCNSVHWNLKRHVFFLILWKWVGNSCTNMFKYIYIFTHVHIYIYVCAIYIYILQDGIIEEFPWIKLCQSSIWNWG